MTANGDAWIVSSGQYSDYSVHAVFTEKELAERYAETLRENNIGIVGVERKLLNPDPPGDWKYTQVVMERDGTVVRVKTWETDDGKVPFPQFRDRGDWEGNMIYTTSELDHEAAIKGANEIRSALLANDWWGDEDMLQLVTSDER